MGFSCCEKYGFGGVAGFGEFPGGVTLSHHGNDALADQFQMVCDEHHDGRVRIVRRHYISRAQVALLSYVTKNTEIALTQTIGLVLVPHAYLVAGRGTGPFRFCLKKNDDSPDNQVARLLACQEAERAGAPVSVGVVSIAPDLLRAFNTVVVGSTGELHFPLRTIWKRPRLAELHSVMSWNKEAEPC